jgi:hypothetical protein
LFHSDNTAIIGTDYDNVILMLCLVVRDCFGGFRTEPDCDLGGAATWRALATLGRSLFEAA